MFQTDKTVPQIAIRWLLQKPNVNSVIVGARSVTQLNDNLGAAKGWKLSDEDVSCLIYTYTHSIIFVSKIIDIKLYTFA